MNLFPFTFVLPVHSPIGSTSVPYLNQWSPLAFPPAQDFYDGYLNLHQYLIPDPNNVFFVRANGDSMIGAGIFDQDLLIVDRSRRNPMESCDCFSQRGIHPQATGTDTSVLNCSQIIRLSEHSHFS